MNPHSHEQDPAFEVPPRQPEHEEVPLGELPDEYVTEAAANKAVEQATSGAMPSAPAPQDQPQAAPVQPVAPQPQSTQSASLPQGWMPQIADDTDLIEKEWVDKAKEIVAHTAHDPYLQNKEINRVRAEYLKKRYNKELKQSE